MTTLTPEQEREIAEAMKEMADKGMLVAAGFAAFRIIALNNSIDRDKIAEMYTAYMAGAEHLFTTIMSIIGSAVAATASVDVANAVAVATSNHRTKCQYPADFLEPCCIPRSVCEFRRAHSRVTVRQKLSPSHCGSIL